MHAELRLNKILTQVQKLNKIEQAALLKKISFLVNGNEQQVKAIKLTEISGLGADLWHDVDIDKYVDEERQW
jgi:hypothetical protein